MQVKLILLLIAVAMLFMPSFGQTTDRAWFYDGMSEYEHGGSVSPANELCDKAIQMDPQWAEAWYWRGVVLADYGMHYRGYENDLSEALQAFDKAIELNPQYADAWAQKAVLLRHEPIEIDNGVVILHKANYTAVLEACDKALEINPNHLDALVNKGIVLAKLGKYEEAKECFDAAIKINPRFVGSLYCKSALPILSDEERSATMMEHFKAITAPEYMEYEQNRSGFEKTTDYDSVTGYNS